MLRTRCTHAAHTLRTRCVCATPRARCCAVAPPAPSLRCRLQNDRSLRGVSHVVVDEVHERSLHGDFLLVILRDLRLVRPELRVVLMSATINANLFANYFRATYVGRPIGRSGGGDEDDGAGAEGGGGDGGGGEGGGSDGIGEGDGEGGGGEGEDGGEGGAGVGPPAADAAPTVHIPGFTHPVTEHQLDHLHMHCACTARALHVHTHCTLHTAHCTLHTAPAHPQVTEHRLEDVLQMTGHVVEEGSQYAKKTRSAERGGGGAGLGFSEMVGRNHSRACGGAAEKAMRRDAVKEEAARVVAEGREGGAADGYPEHVALSLSVMDEEKVNIDAIHALVAHLDATRGPGAVLVFMPGMYEISALHASLASERALQARLLPLPLHSSLAPQEQLRVFDVPTDGKRKVVIATNIAETSITIPDCVYVIDTGRLKETRYDALNSLPQLVDAWISSASRRQRRARLPLCRAHARTIRALWLQHVHVSCLCHRASRSSRAHTSRMPADRVHCSTSATAATQVAAPAACSRVSASTCTRTSGAPASRRTSCPRCIARRCTSSACRSSCSSSARSRTFSPRRSSRPQPTRCARRW